MNKILTYSDILGISISTEDAINLLKQNPTAYNTFLNFPQKYQAELLQFLTGQDCLKITYDTFFCQIFDPHLHPERLESLISAILGQSIRIVEVLQRDGKRLSGDSSLVIMDIVAQLDDGSYLDVELQKIGYAFPGERTCCYASDLILRQYDRLKKQLEKKFSYRDMKPIHVIVLMESSGKPFHTAAPHYLHKRQVSYDSGAQITELTEIVYIALDTFRNVVQNRIDNRLHAWLTFLSAKDAKTILELVRQYPEFLPLYQEIAAFRTKPEELISMFSEALSIMDRNTEIYMIEEAQKELSDTQKELGDTQKELDDTQKELGDAKKKLLSANQENESLKLQIAELQAKLQNNDNNSF